MTGNSLMGFPKYAVQLRFILHRNQSVGTDNHQLQLQNGVTLWLKLQMTTAECLNLSSEQ